MAFCNEIRNVSAFLVLFLDYKIIKKLIPDNESLVYLYLAVYVYQHLKEFISM